MPRARHSSASRNRVAFPPPDLGLMIRTRVPPGAGLDAASAARLRGASATRAQPTDAAASTHASITKGHRRSAMMRLKITKTKQAARMSSDTHRTAPSRDTTYHPATTATASPASARIAHSQFLTAPAASSATAAASVTSASHAAARRAIAIGASVWTRAGLPASPPADDSAPLATGCTGRVPDQRGEPVVAQLADALEAAEAIRDRWAGTRLARVLRQLSDLDHAIYAAIAATPTPDVDVAIRRLSRAADHSRLWLGIAAALAAFGGPRGRHAAARGLLTVGVTSAVVNIGVKSLYPRRRPDRAGAGVPPDRQVAMPSSRSFPSGHSASGFAFAQSVGRDVPALALPLRFLAGAVAYSRVHTGVHYPSDAVIGSIIGAGVAQTVGFTGGTRNAPCRSD